MEALADLWRWLNESKVLGTITYFQGLAGLIGLWVVLGFGRKLLTPKKKGEYLIRVHCNSCGWDGRVSKFTRHCPQCHADQVSPSGRKP